VAIGGFQIAFNNWLNHIPMRAFIRSFKEAFKKMRNGNEYKTVSSWTSNDVHSIFNIKLDRQYSNSLNRNQKGNTMKFRIPCNHA
jgi:hypothetical protein